MAEIREQYIKSTYLLAKSNPAAWAEFLVAFSQFTAYEMERALKTPTSEALITLGMMRRMVELRDDFMGIEKLAEKYQKPK